MPITPQALVNGANYQLEAFAKGDPIDNIVRDRPLLKWLVDNKKESVFGNGIFNEKVRFTNDSNYQNFTGDDQLTYKRKNTVRKAPFQHYEAFDGFALNETELADNGIILTDDKTATTSDAEMIQIVDKLKEGWATTKNGIQENMDLELHLDGTQSTKACPGLDLIVSTTPTVGTIGGIDASVATFWRNNADLAISTATPGNLVKEMEKMWRACMTYGGVGAPDFIPCGSAFYDAYVADSRAAISRYANVTGKGGADLDASVATVNFHGIPLVWDPSFDALDVQLGAITYPWAKRCYFLQSKSLSFRPFKGRWMVKRTPDRMYDRHTHYFGISADYGLTANQRNSMAVLSIA